MSAGVAIAYAILAGMGLGTLWNIGSALRAIEYELSAMRREAREARYIPRPR